MQENNENLFSIQTEHNVKDVINQELNKYITQELSSAVHENCNIIEDTTRTCNTQNPSVRNANTVINTGSFPRDVDVQTQCDNLLVEQSSRCDKTILGNGRVTSEGSEHSSQACNEKRGHIVMENQSQHEQEHIDSITKISPNNDEHSNRNVSESGIDVDLSDVFQGVDLSGSSGLSDTLKTDFSSDSLVMPIQDNEPDNGIGQIGRPDTLSLFDPLQSVAKTIADSELRLSRTSAEKSHQIPINIKKRQGSIDASELSQSLPHGTILRKGEMIEFVAEGLQEKIRMSSPLSRTESSSSRRSSVRSLASTTSSTSMATSMSGMSRSPSSQFQQSPEDIPPIDPFMLSELEIQAQRVADCIDLMMGNLKNNLHKVSAITVGCLDANKMSVDVTCDSVDSSIKAMYALMAKCEELTKSMQPIYKIADQIKEIKRLLDHFEDKLMDKT